ncbi:zinc-binding alcohol dehydrogenase family protein [Streptomyces sp. NBC_00872]|uniref:zinc-binding alcohol dehydrogenase family protein n=1 Tax=Streptomyces sp. NBC_00872 TaxID=2903686 RepID=UPI00386AF8AD|nr:zinc-binding alcohol dehydrogenase family protein [Streptomyces sp. NBC_00872]
MKALVYETAHDLADFALERTEVPEPTLRDQDVLVEVRAIGVNPGEAFIRRIRSAEPGGRVLLGWEFAGVVIAVGEHVRRFTVGERVFGTGDTTRDGSWAERLAVDHRILAKIPQQLSFVDAASLPIGALTASEALFRDQDTLPAGITRVLVLGGAGAVGSLATQLLKTRTSALVISTASREASRQWCSQMGADLVLDHTGDVPAQLNAAGIPHVDMVLSTAASADHLSWIPDILRPFGYLSVVDGVSSLDVGALAAKSLSLHTEMVFSRIVHGADPEAQGQTLESVAEHVAAGRLRPITTRRLDGLTAETMRTAHELVESGRTIGKIVIAT